MGEGTLTDVIVTQTGEKGLASQEPLVEVFEEGKPLVVYGNMSAEKAKRVIVEHVVNGNPVADFALDVM